MIADGVTNFLYLSGCLPKFYPEFFDGFKKVLVDSQIPYELLPNTKDIWARDYMPVQVGTNNFVQFVYDPDYLKPMKYKHLNSNQDDVCKDLNISRKKSKLVVDGGNVIRSADKIIMCDKVFNENSHLKKGNVILELEELFLTDKIYFIPWNKCDYTGHADGMVRFIDEDTVFINASTNENPDYERCLRESLKKAGLSIIELPYKSPEDPTHESARELYLNYLEMNQAIIIPVFGEMEDDDAVKILEDTFTGKSVVTLESNEIAIKGGVLNCISWNIVAS